MLPGSTRTLEEHTGPPVDHGTPAAPLCIVGVTCGKNGALARQDVKTTGHTSAQRRCGVCPRHQRRCPRACIGACVCLPADSDRGVRPHTRSKPRRERAAYLVWGVFTVWGDRYALDVCFIDTPPCSRVFPGSATLQRGFWSRAGARRSQGGAGVGLTKWTSRYSGRQRLASNLSTGRAPKK